MPVLAVTGTTYALNMKSNVCVLGWSFPWPVNLPAARFVYLRD